MRIKFYVGMVSAGLLLIFFMLDSGPSNEAQAAPPDKCEPWPACKNDDDGDDGGDGGGGGGSAEQCTSAVAGFVFSPRGKRGEDRALSLSTPDGCVLGSFGTFPDLRGWFAHMTQDGSSGVILLAEDPGNNSQYVVRRIDFAVDADGQLVAGPPYTILEDSNLGTGDQNLYALSDVWGSGLHEELYLSVYHLAQLEGGDESRRLLIYDLNDMSAGAQQLYPGTAWTCPADELYPESVATCVELERARWNPSGTRLYLSGEVLDWSVAVRMDADLENGAWTFGEPEIVYAGPGGQATYSEPGGTYTRPSSEGVYTAPATEHLIMSYLDRSGQHTQRQVILLNADDCATRYAAYVHGPVPEAVWLDECEHTFLYTAATNRFGGPWQSDEAFVYDRVERRRKVNVHRYHVGGAIAGTSELLIEDAEWADTGY